ncbi:nucleotide-diphospho-sugar transferase [Zopfochytrium polystomum]|nr:nucleotide-diphospho-sugar transferase [Zopfochytrium polystomum]
MSATPTLEELKARYEAAGQSHVFTFIDQLDAPTRAAFLAQLSSFDPSRVSAIFAKATSPTAAASATAALQPLPPSSFASTQKAGKAQVDAWTHRGLEAIAKGQVAVVLLAGGQGTRLGSSAPKGCYDVGLPSHKSLFQLQGERIERVKSLARQRFPQHVSGAALRVPWYVMTSGPTRAPTEAFFKENAFFGVPEEDVLFFEQGVLPAFSMDGKILLDGKGSVSVAPDGNGGIYAALEKEGVLDDLEKRGIPYVHTYCVDNCLVKVADPTFLGYCITQNADCGAKSVPKQHAHEPVGVLCLRNNKFGVVEYSEIPAALAEATVPEDPKTLLYNAANIANHFYTTQFLRKIKAVEGELEYHVAKKKIQTVDMATGVVGPKPTSNNGIKLELFIFDVFPFTERMAVLEVERAEEFSPLKNAPGSKDGDSPDTSRRDLLLQGKRFVEAAGANIGEGVVGIEVAPARSYGGEGLEDLKGVAVSADSKIDGLLVATSF